MAKKALQDFIDVMADAMSENDKPVTELVPVEFCDHDHIKVDGKFYYLMPGMTTVEDMRAKRILVPNHDLSVDLIAVYVLPDDEYLIEEWPLVAWEIHQPGIEDYYSGHKEWSITYPVIMCEPFQNGKIWLRKKLTVPKVFDGVSYPYRYSHIDSMQHTRYDLEDVKKETCAEVERVRDKI